MKRVDKLHTHNLPWLLNYDRRSTRYGTIDCRNHALNKLQYIPRWANDSYMGHQESAFESRSMDSVEATGTSICCILSDDVPSLWWKLILQFLNLSAPLSGVPLASDG